MHFRYWVFALLACIATAAWSQDDSWKQSLGDDRELAADLREEVVKLQLSGSSNAEMGSLLTATLYQPVGSGPFPVVILSHGSPGRASDRLTMGRYRLVPQVRALVARGFAVLAPMRRGYGATGGEYAEAFGSCLDPQFDKTGLESARDVRSAVEYVRSRPSLDSNRVILMGQSAGGFASLAAGAQRMPGVVAVVNFSGGRAGNGINGEPCRPDVMAKLMATYGAATPVPSLWFYVENDKYFGPRVSKQWFDAYQAGSGRSRYVLHPPYKSDGHLLFYYPEAIPIWASEFDQFVRELGLVTG